MQICVRDIYFASVSMIFCFGFGIGLPMWYIFSFLLLLGPGWLNELGSWITKQLIQAYHQYGVGSRPALYITKKGAPDSQLQVIKFTSCHGRWFSPGTQASSTTKPGRHDIAEILLKVAVKHQKSNE